MVETDELMRAVLEREAMIVAAAAAIELQDLAAETGIIDQEWMCHWMLAT